MTEYPNSLPLDEHPTRERVHFPGRPGYVMPGEPHRMVEQPPPATPDDAPTATDGDQADDGPVTTTVEVTPQDDPSPTGAGDTATEAPKPKRRQATEGLS